MLLLRRIKKNLDMIREEIFLIHIGEKNKKELAR
jgi:hypothetical protein